MSQPAYEIMDLPQAEFGETAKIALCETFEQVAQAKQDGCHVALLFNALTQACYEELEKLTIHCASPFSIGMRRKKMGENEKTLFAAMEEAGFTAKRVNADYSDAERFRVHSDVLTSDKDFLALLLASPQMILFHLLSVKYTRNGLLTEGFQVGEDKYVNFRDIKPDNFHGLSSFPVAPGTLVFLFNLGGLTAPHSPPELSKEVKDKRPRLICSGSVPAPV